MPLPKRDDLKLPINSIEVLKQRYLLKDDNRNIIETPSELFRRVASCVATAENNFKSKFNREDVEEKFYQMMRSLEFMPNSPHPYECGNFFRAAFRLFCGSGGRYDGGIFKALKNMARIHQRGGRKRVARSLSRVSQ